MACAPGPARHRDLYAAPSSLSQENRTVPPLIPSTICHRPLGLAEGAFECRRTVRERDAAADPGRCPPAPNSGAGAARKGL